MEITNNNMDLTVMSPGSSPMIPALPNFTVRMTGYTVTLNSTITETDGKSHEKGSSWGHEVQQSTSTTDEWHWDVSTKVSASLTDAGVEMGLSYGESYSVTQSRGTSKSQGGQMSNASQWSLATASNSLEAAQIDFTFEIRNIGTSTATDVRITQNLMIGNMNVATLTYPEAPDTISVMGPNEFKTWNYSKTLNLEQLRALRTGVPVTVEVSTVAAKVVTKEGEIFKPVSDWGLYLTHLFHF